MADVNLPALIDEVFALTPPHPADFNANAEWWAAKEQYEELQPLIVKLAQALEHLITNLESVLGTAREFQALSNRYDDLIEKVIASDTVKLEVYRHALARLASDEPLVDPDSYELAARIEFAKRVLEIVETGHD